MKKITSVAITALVFLFSFMNITFAESKSGNVNGKELNKKKKKMTSGKIENLEKSAEGKSLEQGKEMNLDKGKEMNLEQGKETDLDKSKLIDLEKAENPDKKTSLETIKFEDLERTNLKLDDFRTTTNEGLRLKLENFENKR